MLSEYINTILPRALVKSAATILAEANDPRLDAFTLALERALDRDHHRESLAAIKSILGDLGPGDALAAVASKLAEVGTGASVESLFELERWDTWARDLTGRSSLEGVSRATLRNEIAAMDVVAPAVKRERDALLDAVRAAAGDPRMIADAAAAWVRGSEHEPQSL